MSTVFIESQVLLEAIAHRHFALEEDAKQGVEAALEALRQHYNLIRRRDGFFFRMIPHIMTTAEVAARLSTKCLYDPSGDDFGNWKFAGLKDAVADVKLEHRAKATHLNRLADMARKADGIDLTPDDHRLIYG